MKPRHRFTLEESRRGGRAILESGQLARIRSAGGKIRGRLSVESGHMDRLHRMGGAAAGPITGNAPENVARISAWLPKIDRREAGRKAGHVTGHVNKGVINPRCKYCCGLEPESFLLEPEASHEREN